MRLIQLQHTTGYRRVGIIEEPNVRMLDADKKSIYELFSEIINNSKPAEAVIDRHKTAETLSYDEIYAGSSPWKILPAADVPEQPMLCMLSGTGLTHKASAENREKMHQMDDGELSDSMKMYLWGEEGGKPAPGQVGVQPEWFYKGNGSNLKAYGDHLSVPEYADDGGEEPEIAGVYLISRQGFPFRIGFAQANEFSDHVMEKKNYLYLAPSKLRPCALGPELVTDLNFGSIPGEVSILRSEQTLWSKDIRTGEAVMAHSLANLEYHHFKYEQHRIPGLLHIHFFGAGAFSFGEGISLEDGDQMKIHFQGLGRPLINTVHQEPYTGKVHAVRTCQ